MKTRFNELPKLYVYISNAKLSKTRQITTKLNQDSKCESFKEGTENYAIQYCCLN